MPKPKYADLGDHDEDKRIRIIVAQVMLGKTVGVVTDSDPGKADRYVEKVKAALPGVPVNVERSPGPVPNTVLLRFKKFDPAQN